MGDYEKFLSRREEQILKTLGYENENKNVAHEYLPKSGGGHITASAVRSHTTRMFQRYIEALEVMADFYPIFHGRFNKHDSRIKKIQKRINKRRREAIR